MGSYLFSILFRSVLLKIELFKGMSGNTPTPTLRGSRCLPFPRALTHGVSGCDLI